MNGQLVARAATEAESEMLPQDPPAWLARAAAWLFIALFAIALVVACVVPLPETVNSQFVLAPRDGADPIQSPYLAMLHKIAVNEGDAVKAGAELFVLRADEVRNLDIQSRGATEDLREREASLEKADSAYQAQVEIKDAEIAQAETEVGFRERHVKTSRELVERMDRLSRSGGISQIELLRLRLDLAGSEKDLSISERTLQQVRLERQRMEMDRSRQRGQDVSEIEKIKYRLTTLQRDLENADQNLLTLRAPYDAVVISVAQRSTGSIVQNGQELCQLARIDAKPRARLLLTESGAPKLAPPQPVRFFFEAFPYQRYGAVNGTLDWVSPTVVTSVDGPRFVALASIDEADLAKRAKPLAIRVGMRGQARIKVGTRTLIEYAFEPIKQLRENTRG